MLRDSSRLTVCHDSCRLVREKARRQIRESKRRSGDGEGEDEAKKYMDRDIKDCKFHKFPPHCVQDIGWLVHTMSQHTHWLYMRLLHMITSATRHRLVSTYDESTHTLVVHKTLAHDYFCN